MKMFSKNNGASFFLPKADFQVQKCVRGWAVFESEPIDLSAYSIFGNHRISCRYDVVEYLAKREIAH